MQIKITLRFCLALVRMAITNNTHTTTNAGEEVWKKGTLAHGNVNLCKHYGKTVWKFLKILKIEQLYDPAIPLLDTYPKECKPGDNRATCTPMLIAALFTIAKLWKSPDALQLLNGLIKCSVYIHNGVLFSHKGEWNYAVCR
jgi:hypothetical protein